MFEEPFQVVLIDTQAFNTMAKVNSIFKFEYLQFLFNRVEEEYIMIYRVDILVLKCVFAWVVLSMHAAQDPAACDSKSEKAQSWLP